MIGINRKDIQAILKAGAKAKGMSTSDIIKEITHRTVFFYLPNEVIFLLEFTMHII